VKSIPTLAMTLVLAGATATPAMAQSLDFTRLVSQCARGACDNAISSVVARLATQETSAEDANLQFGRLAIELFNLAKTADDDTQARLVRSLTRLAEASTDPDQAAAMLVVAEIVARGEAGLYDLSDPMSVSPS